MMTRAQMVRVGYTVANTYIALTLILLFLETTRFHRLLSDHGPLFMLVSLFFIIPAFAIVLWKLNRSCRAEHSGIQKAYLVLSRALFDVAWLFSCIPIILWINIKQPWPLTMRYGPDTHYAREGFAKLMGFAPPTSVSHVYYCASEGWLDIGYILRFTCRDASLVTQVVSRLQLQESGEPQTGLVSEKAMWWWTEKQQHGKLKCFLREKPGTYYWHLWYDPESGVVWYEEFSV